MLLLTLPSVSIMESMEETCVQQTMLLNAPQPITTSSNQATVIFQATNLPHSHSRVGVGITYTTIQNGK